MHNVPKNSETHFKVIVVSEEFENKKMVRALMKQLFLQLLWVLILLLFTEFTLNALDLACKMTGCCACCFYRWRSIV